MAKTNIERIRKIKTELQEIEKRIIQVEEQINNSKIFLDEISEHKTSAEQQNEQIESAKNSIQSFFDEVKGIKEEVNNTKEELNSKLNATEIKKEEFDKFFIKIFGEKDEKGNLSGGLKDRLKQKEEGIDRFLATQEEVYKKLFQKIESLLPAATSAGLASAYAKQKDSYKHPNIFWAIFFVISLIGVCATGLISFEEFKLSFKTLKNFEELFSRSPFLIALIWLATFSSKQYRQNKRLEQEYAHKEVLARSYQGYKKEFESQEEAKDTNKEIISGLHKVLIESIAKNPSEIMDDGRSEDAPSIWKKPFDFLGNKNKE